MSRKIKHNTMKVKTNLRGGEPWWLFKCFQDHWNNLSECCVPGATPKGCNSCLQTCIDKYYYQGRGDNTEVYKCATSSANNCFG